MCASLLFRGAHAVAREVAGGVIRKPGVAVALQDLNRAVLAVVQGVAAGMVDEVADRVITPRLVGGGAVGNPV